MVMETALPNDIEVNLLRNVIDPLNIRRLEMLGGAARRELLHKIIVAEKHNIAMN
jgi:hypothetical protein